MHIMNTNQWLTENSAPTQLAQIKQNFANSVLTSQLIKSETKLNSSNVSVNTAKISQIAQDIINSKEFVRIS